MILRYNHRFGEVAEWLNVPDSKSGVRYPRTEGSNPSLSAKRKTGPSGPVFVLDGPFLAYPSLSGTWPVGLPGDLVGACVCVWHAAWLSRRPEWVRRLAGRPSHGQPLAKTVPGAGHAGSPKIEPLMFRHGSFPTLPPVAARHVIPPSLESSNVAAVRLGRQHGPADPAWHVPDACLPPSRADRR